MSGRPSTLGREFSSELLTVTLLPTQLLFPRMFGATIKRRTKEVMGGRMGKLAGWDIGGDGEMQRMKGFAERERFKE